MAQTSRRLVSVALVRTYRTTNGQQNLNLNLEQSCTFFVSNEISSFRRDQKPRFYRIFLAEPF